MTQNNKENALKIIKALLFEGHAAFLVGGCVRDIVMGNTPDDFDIATSAKADEIIRIAGENSWKNIPVGQAFGVIIILIDAQQYEVASFRTDTYGQDGHRPLFVKPVHCIEDDLARRDFTFNAMAMDIEGNLIDPFGGVSDLTARTIRAVGNADKRFAEDALRMFRAIRFAAKLDFKIEPATFAAIAKNSTRARGLSAERISAEIEKIITSGHPETGVQLLLESSLAAQVCRARSKKEEFSVDILPELQYLSKLAPHQLSLLSAVPSNVILRWTALLHLIAAGMDYEFEKNTGNSYSQIQPGSQSIEKVLSIPERLKVRSKQLKTIAWLLKNRLNFPCGRPQAVEEWLAAIAEGFSNYKQMRRTLAYLILLHKAEANASPAAAGQLRALVKIINASLKSLPFFVGQLAVSGREIAAELGFGSQVKRFQLDALAKIQKGVFKNSPEHLRKALASEKLGPSE